MLFRLYLFMYSSTNRRVTTEKVAINLSVVLERPYERELRKLKASELKSDV